LFKKFRCFHELVQIGEIGLYDCRIIGAKILYGKAAAVEHGARTSLPGHSIYSAVVGSDFNRIGKELALVPFINVGEIQKLAALNIFANKGSFQSENIGNSLAYC